MLRAYENFQKFIRIVGANCQQYERSIQVPVPALNDHTPAIEGSQHNPRTARIVALKEDAHTIQRKLLATHFMGDSRVAMIGGSTTFWPDAFSWVMDTDTVAANLDVINKPNNLRGMLARLGGDSVVESYTRLNTILQWLQKTETRSTMRGESHIERLKNTSTGERSF